MGGDQLTGVVELTVGDRLAGRGTRLLTKPTEAVIYGGKINGDNHQQQVNINLPLEDGQDRQIFAIL